MKTVTVIDYGMSNLRSVSKALEHVAGKNWHVNVSQSPHDIVKADKVVFPGQGAIAHCMQVLTEQHLTEVIVTSLKTKPFLGICLGLQSLLKYSEENGGVNGFNHFAGEVKRFPTPLLEENSGERLKIPHMGWSPVHWVQPHPLWQGIPDNSRFYFVHSYYVAPRDEAVTAGQTCYGSVCFTSAAARDNVFAVQFHPEKSQKNGLTLLENFLDW
ncbi:imidazole glycerol phosphate synthase subunit HisH [Thioflexithrix psekupsensis]|uniref:Imidazole glycerol phosphate synthase subunit HisH n=1 Tax=Thioflexithrix psekupsensis TaxID=1570016 RepID=A0A251X386_9GAMM|nr:imidazole glycerol phosphate synthase subunit HisH [Thioflexithrix psekupsensis]OUD11638.1 imidazole glycerol phosphate synthase subunit HisH [Thioflexithrix psekupsensis]